MIFHELGVGHLEFKMANILTQTNKNFVVLITITMQHETKNSESVATRDS